MHTKLKTVKVNHVNYRGWDQSKLGFNFGAKKRELAPPVSNNGVSMHSRDTRRNKNKFERWQQCVNYSEGEKAKYIEHFEKEYTLQSNRIR